LVDEEENCSKPLVTVPASEGVVWVSPGIPDGTPDILVTFDTDKGDLSIWRYAYVKPKDAPVPLTRTNRSASRKRMSVGRRQSSSIGDLLEMDRRLPQDVEFDDAFPPPFPPSTTAGVPGRKRESLSRLDLSSTLDRMALGGQKDADVLMSPVEHGRMKASYWAHRLATHRLGGSQYEIVCLTCSHTLTMILQTVDEGYLCCDV